MMNKIFLSIYSNIIVIVVVILLSTGWRLFLYINEILQDAKLMLI